MQPGIYLDIPEEDYHSDAINGGKSEPPSLSSSIAQCLILESEAHAYLRHPKLGGKPFTPNNNMDRGSLIHALLLGKGKECAIVECDDWKKPGNRELRDAHRAAGRLAVTRALYDASIEAASALALKLKKRGVVFGGHSEVTIVWDETARDDSLVRCRSRLDHLDGPSIWDLKITGDASPKTVRNQIIRMGYDIQGAGYTSAVESSDIRLRGRSLFRLVFCEPEPPYCITVVRFAGTMKRLGEAKWKRAVNTWSRCLSTGEWGDYQDSEVVAEARPWELEEEGANEDDANAA